MKGLDLYEQWRSCVHEVSGFISPSWEALEVWERRAWELLYTRCSDEGPDEDLPF